MAKIDPAKVISMYRNDMLSSVEIAAFFGTSIPTVLQCLRKNDIPRRNKLESHSLRNGIVKGKDTYRKYEWLYHQYCVLGKSRKKIAEETGTGPSVIQNWMEVLNIPTRSRFENAKLHVKHFEMTDNFNSFINGLLLGDGNLSSYSTVSARYGHTAKHLHYIEDLKERFSFSGIQIAGKINTNKHIVRRRKVIGYSLTTLSYAELLPIWERWYPKGKKIVPNDINLTPITCLHWYIGDGSLRNSYKWRPSIKISTHCFTKEDILLLISKLEELRISANYWPSCNSIGIGVDDTPKFLAYIGSCPNGVFSSYGYRFDATRSKAEWEAEFTYA